MVLSKQNVQKSILVLGATGRTGLECIRELSNHESNPLIHAFCRDASKLTTYDKALCASVIQGNAKCKRDIEMALTKSKADVVIVSLGNGDSVAKSDIRTVSAELLANAMRKAEFRHVRALIISSVGAGSSRIIVGFGIGKVISYHLKHVLSDHTGQELAFSTHPELRVRACIVRATALTDNKATGKLVTFEDREKSPSIETDRVDLADWVTKEIFRNSPLGGKVVNVTGVKI
jgi:hypothetical protein